MSTIQAIHPVSPLQEFMLREVNEQRADDEPRVDVYREQLICTLLGSLDVPAFGRAWQEVIDRNDILRSFFAGKRGPKHQQVIINKIELSLRQQDWRALSATEQEAALKTLLETERSTGFDPYKPPVTRLTLCRSDAQTFQFVWSYHRLLLDRQSAFLIFGEVLRAYEQFGGARGAAVGAVPASARPYADYIGWLKRHEPARAAEFWRQELANYSGPTVLPAEKISGGQADAPSPYAREQLPLAVVTANALGAFEREYGISLSTLLAGAWAFLLSRYSREREVVFGVMTSGRCANLDGIDAMAGPLSQTLPMHVSVDGMSKLLPWLTTYEARLSRRRKYESNSPEQVRLWSGVASLPAQFESTVVLDVETENDLPAWQTDDLELRDLRIVGGENSPLTLRISRRDGLAFQLDYDSTRFERDAVRRLLHHLQTFIENILAQPTREPSLVTAAERRELLLTRNRTARPYPLDATLHSLFEAQAARSPHRIALASASSPLSYSQLNSRANRLARHLRARGVGPEQLVGVCLRRSPEMAVALLAVLKAGGAYLPLDPDYPSERLRFMLDDARPALVLTQGGLLGRLSAGTPALCLEAEAEAVGRRSAEDLAPAATADNLAYVIYTSGSTGRPKGVMVEHRGLTNYLSHAAATYLKDGVWGSVVSSPLGFDATLTTLLAPLTAGRRVELLPDDEQTMGLLAERLFGSAEALLFKLTPAHLEALLYVEKPAEVWGAGHVIVVGGEQLGAALLERWKREFLPEATFVNEYGPTEAVVGCSVWTLCDEDGLAGLEGRAGAPIGLPIGNTQLYVLDGVGEPVPDGVSGELYIGGEGVGRGYLGRPGLTGERFVPDGFGGRAGARLYRTGDVVRWREGGLLEYVGRTDHQIKVRGYRIELGEIEAVLTAHPAVRAAAVELRAGRSGDKSLTAYVACDEEPRAGELREWMLTRVPEYMVPSAFVTLKELPLTANGKLDRRALPEAEGGASRPSSAYVAPRDVVELGLCRIWEEMLGVAPVGVRDRFFDLGGHSLAATRLMYRIERSFARRLPVAALFASPTVEHLAGLLRRQAGTAAPFSPLVEIQPGAGRPPFFCVHPSGGNVLCYAELARHLGPDQPFYGLQARGLGHGLAPHASIEEMAREYVAHLRAAWPGGPYLLGGWSMGGVVAYEMARQLEAEGAEVALLALLDSAPRAGGSDDADELSLLRDFALDMGLAADEVKVAPEELAGLGLEERIEYLLGRAVAADVLPPDVAPDEVLRLFGVFKANVSAMQNYAPSPTGVAVTLFRAQERDGAGRDALGGWPRGLRAEVRGVPGSHFTLVREPHVRVLAEELGASIDRALAPAL